MASPTTTPQNKAQSNVGDNPVKDTDHDGILSGAELLEQMAAEEEQGGLRTPP